MTVRLTHADLAQLTGAAPPRKGKGKKAVPLEREIQRSIVAYLWAIGATVVRVNSGCVVFPASEGQARRALHGNLTPGCSDLLCCLASRFIAIEVKRPGGRLTEKQANFLADVQRSGGLGIVVVSVADLEAKLNAEGLL